MAQEAKGFGSGTETEATVLRDLHKVVNAIEQALKTCELKWVVVGGELHTKVSNGDFPRMFIDKQMVCAGMRKNER